MLRVLPAALSRVNIGYPKTYDAVLCIQFQFNKKAVCPSGRAAFFVTYSFLPHILSEEVILMRYQRHKIDRYAMRWRIRLGLLAAGVLFVAVNIAVRPRLKQMTAIQAAYISNHAIDQAAEAVLSREDIDYESFVTLHTLEDGSISSMTANIREMNRFKTELSNEVQKKILEYK